MDDPQNPISDKPCEICGHVGWVDALSICSKCKVTCEHKYCMRIAYSGECDDEEEWVCDECDSSNLANQIPLKPASSKPPSGTGVRILFKPPKNGKVRYISPEEAMVLESGAMRNNISPSKPPSAHRSLLNKPTSSAPPQKFKIKPNPTVGLSGCREPLNDWSEPCGPKDRRSSASNEDNHVFQKEHAWQDSSASRRPLARNTQASNVMMQKEKDESARRHYGESPAAKHVSFGKLPKPAAEKQNISSSYNSVQLSQRLPAVSSDGCAQQFGINTPTAELFPNKIVSGDDINSGDTSQSVQIFPTVTSGMDVCIEASQKKTDSKRESPTVTVVLDRYLPNHPAMSPTWRGTFQITNAVELCTVLNDVQAHPPCKVHRKVYQVSKQFPKTLALSMLPRMESWVDIFEGDVPGELDIGLYFLSPWMSNVRESLPASTCDLEQRYYSLLEYLDEHDFLLRASFDEVELIVFSSKHLPENSCQINQKSFMWGVLRPSRADIGASEAEPSREESLPVGGDAFHPSDSHQIQQPTPEEDEAEDSSSDMVLDMLGGNELHNVDVVVPKPTNKQCDDHIEAEMEQGNEVKGLPKSTGKSGLELSAIKIKREWPDDNLKALEDADLEFDREIQKSFDRFAALMDVKDEACVVRNVKEESDA